MRVASLRRFCLHEDLKEEVASVQGSKTRELRAGEGSAKALRQESAQRLGK